MRSPLKRLGSRGWLAVAGAACVIAGSALSVSLADPINPKLIITEVEVNDTVSGFESKLVRARCPQGTHAISGAPSPGNSQFLQDYKQGQRDWVMRVENETGGSDSVGLVIQCAEGEDLDLLAR